MVEEDPRCDIDLNNGTEPCTVCWDTRSEEIQNTSLWVTCNENDGYTGRLCQKCMVGFARDQASARKCRKCGDTETNWFFICLGIMVALSFLAFFIKINIDVAGSSSTSGAAQKIYLNYLQTVSLASSFPLLWPPEIQAMFNVQSSASSFSDQLMDFDCEMAKSGKLLHVFYQKQLFFLLLPITLVVINIIYWTTDALLERFNKCHCCKAKSKHKQILHKKRLTQFKNFAKKAHVSHSRNSSTARVLYHASTNRDSNKEQLNQEIEAYKAALTIRGDGKAVRLARKLMSHLHDELGVSTEELFRANGTKNGAISRNEFIELMESLKLPFSHTEIMSIAYLLDPQHTNLITISSLVSFHRTIMDKVILSSSIIMFIVYPSVTKSLFKLVSCRDNLTPANGITYLVNDLELQCYTPMHIVFVLCVGLPGLILYIIGFPLSSIFAMYGGHTSKSKNKGETDSNKFAWSDRSLFRYSMFLNGYKVEKYYWECIIALRKSCLTFISVFFGSLGVHAQSYFGLVIIFLCIIVHIANTPFATTELNFLETMALSISFLTLYLGKYKLYISYKLSQIKFYVKNSNSLICMYICM